VLSSDDTVAILGQTAGVNGELEAGLREDLVTRRLARTIAGLESQALFTEVADLRNAEAADRVSQHIARLLAKEIEAAPEADRAARAVALAESVLGHLRGLSSTRLGLDDDVPEDPARLLHAILARLPDGTPRRFERPLTPLLDTTILTNAPGEPNVGRELRAEIDSAHSIDVVMAFVRWSGVRPLFDALEQHVRQGKRLRILTTIYTGTTEHRALEKLQSIGAQIKVSYDTGSTRLHAKAWIFHRHGGYSTGFVGSSNLTQMAQVTGMEWNVRVAEARNPDVISKISAVFESYWASADFIPYESAQFVERTRTATTENAGLLLSPLEIQLKPFQERLLEEIQVSRQLGHHHNLLVAATGTGKTVMAAVDYANLRSELPRDRLLFVAHRHEILDQSRRTFAHALRDASFGEMWVRGQRPTRFDHVFASIQSLNARGIAEIDPHHFDVVIIDEFHHTAAPSYDALLQHLQPRELLGLTATPERSDGVDVLGYFGGRIAAELRLWDAIDQNYLAPFSYYGIHDGTDLREVGWRRGRGYDIDELTTVLTADKLVANRVIEQVRRTVSDPLTMRALGFCVSVKHARFMAERFSAAGLPSVAIWGETPADLRANALRDLQRGIIAVVFTVDLFNEGVDVPSVDTLLLLRPTESGTLFLQQLGRGLRRTAGKAACTVLDFVGRHRTEFRYDRKFRALLGGSRRNVEDAVASGFPFLPSGCHMELDRVAQEEVLRSIQHALPTRWAEKCRELGQLGDVDLGTFLHETGLELEDVYENNRSWTVMRRAVGLPTLEAGPDEDGMLRAIGRLLHVDDIERLSTYERFLAAPAPRDVREIPEREARLLRMLVASLTTKSAKVPYATALDDLWAHPQVRAEALEVVGLLRGSITHLDVRLDEPDVPLHLHARYTRIEILAAYGAGSGARPPDWREGVRYEESARTDLFAFTLDKSSKGFSPTTRYRDYAITPELIHWESQSSTSVASATGQRYINHEALGTRVVLFARLSTADRGLWCLGPATYVSHTGERPIAFTWRLHHRLPADLYTAFAAAVA